MKTDIQIAQESTILPITDIAHKMGIDPDLLEPYGKHKAKLSQELYNNVRDNENGKLILVTATNPTPAGEGKTTVSVGLGQALCGLGKNSIITLREPSLGPCMGIKGGAAGGGYSQVIPMEDINLHFTGDIHAIGAANNLLASIIDNHIHQGNDLQIDPRQITWKRVVDLNDRALRNTVVGLGGPVNGMPREDNFMITVASEIMAILCLADDIHDLKKRLGNIIIGYDFDLEPVTAQDLEAHGAMTVILKDAIKPNLVQTLENTPAIMHGGPFANIAHGCNSVMATKMALKMGDYVVTEAGFGADLGAEKFFDIKCRSSNLKPDAVVIVTTIRALKYNGGMDKTKLTTPNIDALDKGFVNLEKHIENIEKYKVPAVVTLNAFATDSKEEMEYIEKRVKELGCEFAISEVWEKGGKGGQKLAKAVLDTIETKESNFETLYNLDLSIEEKIEIVATEIYGASNVVIAPKAKKIIKRLNSIGLDKLPICMAKNQYSLSDDPTLLGRPKDFEITISNISVSAGAGFIVALTGNVMTMPGLPKVPSANKINIDKTGKIKGLF